MSLERSGNHAAGLRDADYIEWADELGRGSRRGIFLDVVRGRFHEIVEGRSPGLTFTFALFGAPWHHDWQGPNMEVLREAHDEQRYALIHAAMMSARVAARDFFVTGFQRDAGNGWLGAERGHGAEETRVYDREPIVISFARYKEKLFTPHWFEATISGAIHVAAAMFPQRHPDLKIFATIWRLTNESDAQMRINDSISRPHDFSPPEYFDTVVSAIEPIGKLIDRPDRFAHEQVVQCIRTLRSRYNVPDYL